MRRVPVKTVEHTDQWFEAFANAVLAIPEVTEFHRTSGDINYVPKFQLADIVRDDEICKCPTRSARCASENASFSMEKMDHTTAISPSGTN